MPVLTILDAKVPVIRIAGGIDMPMVFGPLDELQLLHGYCQFRDIELQIDIPGGSAGEYLTVYE
jgi:hypothetical protein